MKKQITAVKNKIEANKTKILVTVAVVSTTVAVLQNRGISNLNEFLKEKDLYDEYYTPDMDE